MKRFPIGAACALFPLSAVAQEDVLVVTAERRAAPLSEVPAAISVLREEEVRLVSPRAPAELLNRAAGVFVQSGSGREHLTAIRSPVLTGGAGAGSFLFLQDGIPLRAAGFANVNGLFDAQLPFAEAVEIVRGPGDVAYGSNALHGAVNVLTPEPGDPGGRLRLSAGSFDRYSATLEGGNGRARGGLHMLDDGGYRENSGALQVKGFGKVKLGETTLRIAGQHLEQETAGYILGDEAYAENALRRSNPNPEAFRDLDHLLLSAEIPFAAAGWEGAITPFARYTQMDFLLHFFPGDPLEENEHGSIGLQSTASRALSDEVEILAGLDLDLTRGSLREFQENETVFSFTQGLHYDYSVDAVEAAPFARLSWQAAGNLTLQAGGRVTLTRYDYETDADAGVFGRYFRPEDRTDEFGVVTGKLAALYELGPNGTVYASLARGARPPQTSELYRLQSAQTPDGIDPETMNAIELGWRKASERGRIAVTGFAMRKEDVFFRDADGFNVTDGETTHVGIEAEGLLHLTETLSLSGAGTWASHEYAFDRIVSDVSEIIRDGDMVDTAPKTLGTAQLLWTPVPELTLEAAYTHVASYYTNAANTQEYGGHDLLDLRASWSPAERLTLLGIVRNVTDERYARRADYAFGNARYFPGEERAYEVNLTVAF